MFENFYSITDMEHLTGIKAHTIRIWEKRYKLFSPSRSAKNVRSYCDADLRKLLNVSLLNRNDLKISKIAQLTDEELKDKILNLSLKSSCNDSQIENLIFAMMELDEKKFEKTISNASINLGFENTITDIVYPFFEKVRIFWQTGNVNPAQEHFITNLLRQKLIVAIDGLISSLNSFSKRFILFLPENEWYEIDLLFSSYIVKKNNHELIYLGQSIPLESLKKISLVKPPDVLVTSVTSPISNYRISKYLTSLSTAFPDVPIFVSGIQMKDFDLDLPANTHVILSLEEFKQEIADI